MSEARSEEPDQVPCVILLHGITKDRTSMEPIAQALLAQGFYVANIDYPSRQYPIQVLAEMAVPRGLAACERAGAAPVHFVAHSMGALLLRQYFAQRSAQQVRRVVMLGPPNRGSRLGNFLSCIPWIKDINGPAGKQMGVDEHSVPSQLGPLPFPAGVIAGTRSWNPLFAAIIEGDDDGIVGLPSTYVQGVCARVVKPVTHDGLTSDKRVIEEVVRYLRAGKFKAPDAEYFSCEGQ
ncbi:alpha/beta fold hydrolase [Microbulbifer sp. SA54]|uniref:alpha/beta fold hydrolase n=1 Tax=Microbulbifer sp. SA54 TaxID=3401577 RepID=UPI003AAF7C14